MNQKQPVTSIMNKNLLDSIDLFTDGWGEISSFWGINRVMAQLYALLFSSNRPLTLDDMSERLGISRSNVSTNIRALKDWGIIRKKTIKGDRRDFYEIDDDIWKVIIQFIRERKKRELEPIIEVMKKSIVKIESSLDEMDESDRMTAATFLTRLKNLERISSVVNFMLEQFLVGKEINSGTLKEIQIDSGKKPEHVQ